MSIKLNISTSVLLLAAALLVAGCGGGSGGSFQGSTDEKPLATGLQTLESGGVEREFFLQLPGEDEDGGGIQAAAVAVDTGKPLLFLLHGYTGSYQNWIGEDRFYDLVDVVGDDAIIVAPNGLADASGKRVWGGEKDELFFIDIIAELDRRGLEYNPKEIFVAGHSNGAGFTHELGCAYGDVIRGIATAAGALTSTDCVGSIAALLMQGSNDPLTSSGLAKGALQYWVLYNGWETDQFVPAAEGPCDDYSFPGEPNSPYPVLWCEHTQGHDWPDYGSQAVWDFFQGLEEVEPTLDPPLPPPDGGSERATPPSDTTLTFQLAAPADMSRPLRGVVTLRPLSWIDAPTCSAPDVILGEYSVDGNVIPGQVSEPITIPITYFDLTGGLVFPSERVLNLTVYVEGGGTFIPSPGLDHDTSVAIMLISKETPLILSDVLTLAPAPDLCNF